MQKADSFMSVGVGRGVDEKCLAALADAGGGSCHVLEHDKSAIDGIARATSFFAEAARKIAVRAVSVVVQDSSVFVGRLLAGVPREIPFEAVAEENKFDITIKTLDKEETIRVDAADVRPNPSVTLAHCVNQASEAARNFDGEQLDVIVKTLGGLRCLCRGDELIEEIDAALARIGAMQKRLSSSNLFGVASAAQQMSQGLGELDEFSFKAPRFSSSLRG